MADQLAKNRSGDVQATAAELFDFMKRVRTGCGHPRTCTALVPPLLRDCPQPLPSPAAAGDGSRLHRPQPPAPLLRPAAKYAFLIFHPNSDRESGISTSTRKM